MERITGAVYLDQAQTGNLKGGRIEPASQMIMLTAMATALGTAMATASAIGSGDTWAVNDGDTSATAD